MSPVAVAVDIVVAVLAVVVAVVVLTRRTWYSNDWVP